MAVLCALPFYASVVSQIHYSAQGKIMQGLFCGVESGAVLGGEAGGPARANAGRLSWTGASGANGFVRAVAIPRRAVEE